jgi:predicted CoA-binding protein
MAVKSLLQKGHNVVAIGQKSGEIAGVTIQQKLVPFKGIDTVTLYMNPKNQIAYYNYILALKPKRVIFNPGTENKAFESLLQSNGITSEIACTLVLLSTNQY